MRSTRVARGFFWEGGGESSAHPHRYAAALAAAQKADGSWEVDEEGARVSLLYEFCEDADGAEVQVLDRVYFHVPSRTLELALPGGLPFRHVLLIDVQTFASIAEPLDLDAI